ncbi:hypothetical protein [Nonomuraea sp. NPDC002799]
MPSRYRSGRPALLVAGLYLVVLAVAAVIALTTGDVALLWRLTLFTEVSEDVPVTWPNVLVVALIGLPWAWALWQSLRGPLAGPPPTLDRSTRWLRVALYVAAAHWLLTLFLPVRPWWAALLEGAVMGVVVLLFHPVLGDSLEHAGMARAAGVLAYGGAAVLEVLDVLDVSTHPLLLLLCLLAGLVWTVLVLRAQRWDGRWHGDTVVYGIAALAAPLLLPLLGLLLLSETDIYAQVAAAGGVLTLIWLARSAHDLADPRHHAAPAPAPVSTEPL